MMKLREEAVLLEIKSVGVLAILMGLSFPAGADDGKGTVVLLHGLLNRPVMMKWFEVELKQEGYNVVNWGYPSRSKTVEEDARDLDSALAKIKETDTLHFVGFSLGGLIARYYLTHYPPAREGPVSNATGMSGVRPPKHMGRLVLIGPPNHGSERIEQLYPYGWFRKIWGSTTTWQLRASNKEFFNECGIPACPFGIIAGGKGDDEGYSSVLPGDDDGAVSVESAKLPGAVDFILLHHRHTFLLFGRDTVKNTVAFLNRGKFIHDQR